MAIRSFKNEDAKRVWDGGSPKRIPHNLLKVADRKLAMIDSAKSLEDLRCPPSNHLEGLKGNRLGQHSIRINPSGAFVSLGLILTHGTLKLWTITTITRESEGEIIMVRKRNPSTPGDILKHEFMEPLSLTAYRVAKETGLQPIHISEIIKGKRRITAETSLLLGKYLGTPPTYWMDLQTSHDLRAAQRQIVSRLDAVVPLAK